MLSCENQGAIDVCECDPIDKPRAVNILNLLTVNAQGSIYMLRSGRSYERKHESPSVDQVLPETLGSDSDNTMQINAEEIDTVYVNPIVDHINDLANQLKTNIPAPPPSSPHMIKENVILKSPTITQVLPGTLGNTDSTNTMQMNAEEIDTVGPIVVSFIDLSDQEETKIPDLPFSLQNIQDDSILKSSTIDQVLPKKLSTDSTKTMQFGAEEINTVYVAPTLVPSMDLADPEPTYISDPSLSPHKNQDVSSIVLGDQEHQAKIPDRPSSPHQSQDVFEPEPSSIDQALTEMMGMDSITTNQINADDAVHDAPIVAPSELSDHQELATASSPPQQNSMTSESSSVDDVLPDTLSSISNTMESNAENSNVVNVDPNAVPCINSMPSIQCPVQKIIVEYYDNIIDPPSSPQKNRNAAIQGLNQKAEDIIPTNSITPHHSANFNLKLCKLFAQGSCNTHGCSYLHSEFPCTHYYLNISHDIAKCRFSHGPPLDDAMRYAFMRHLESNSIEMLGEFAAIHPFNLTNMFLTRQRQLQQDLETRHRESPDGVRELNTNPQSLGLRINDKTVEKLSIVGITDPASFGSLSVDQLVKCRLDISEVLQIMQITKNAGPKINSKLEDLNNNSSQTVKTDNKKIIRRKLSTISRKRQNSSDQLQYEPRKIILKEETSADDDFKLGFSPPCIHSSIVQVKSPDVQILSPDDMFKFPLRMFKMPFDPVMDKFIPATEIQASFNMNSKFKYQLFEIDVPKLDTSKFLRNAAAHFVDVHKDPRLNRVAKKLAPFKIPVISSLDPRRRLDRSFKIPKVISNPIDDQPWKLLDRTIVQSSGWYSELNSSHKIMVNQLLAILKTELQAFHTQVKINQPLSLFDLSVIKQNPLLQQALVCLNLFVDENGFCQKVEQNNGDGATF